MADLSDVCNALIGLAAGFVYPNGTGSASVAATPVRLYYGQPVPSQLTADLETGTCHVSVYSFAKARDTTRFLTRFEDQMVNTPTLTLTVSGQTVTVGGTVPPASNPTNLVIFVGYAPVVYQAKPTDTLATIATALAALISGASASGAVITLPNTAILGAVRVGITGTSANVPRNQERLFQIKVWADTPAHRDQIGAALSIGFAPISRVTLPDTSVGVLKSADGMMVDSFEKSTLYTRELLCTVDYATLQSESATEVTQVETVLGISPATTVPPQETYTEYS